MLMYSVQSHSAAIKKSSCIEVYWKMALGSLDLCVTLF